MLRRLAPLLAAAVLAAAPAHAAPTPTTITEADGGFTLLRDGEPYAIRGVGGTTRLAELAAAGANSLRTWGVDATTRPLLDEAHALGLSVTVGLWMEHERHGHSYDDPAFVKEQHDELLAQARSLMDHPAVLMWGVGNEMEGAGARDAVYAAVNDLAAALKAMDPDHPTMTVIADLGPGAIKAEKIRDLCPAVDVVGINSYGGAINVGDRYAAVEPAVGKPWALTEHGPLGHWEVGKAAWGTPVEQTSTQKADFYRRGYEASVNGHPDTCLGTYAFLWGDKQETTDTWYGMFLADGSRTAAVDTMTRLWSGDAPADLAPAVSGLTLDGDVVAAPGATLVADLEATDPEGEPLEVAWVLREASAGDGVGGDFEPRTAEVSGVFTSRSADSATLRLPEKPGAYRLFAYARDPAGHAATANVPVLVRVPPEPLAGGGADLPFRVDPEGAAAPWTPSGFMGDVAATTLEVSREAPRTGETCLVASFTGASGWGGVVWQHPANDWGDLPGGHDLRPATTLSWWARGARGGERVKFGLGVLGADKPHPDTGSAETTVTLTDAWKRYELDLAGADLSRIKTGFLFAVEGRGRPVRFFLDDIAYE
ncbi:glycoside hydrolase family 2 TIM barrel-domain containing protein [Phycisphaera mikurensis]|uniref:Glycoside hydrolase family 2 catalytic domain-containing protein n=1 Tax=Phycisphaera mikurensis (strain NBRC 102666 / KCTC 22515 / FYK2301M01) TaxID=1142394 RepID=I0ICZ7_PHYMF|nr:glycoside hydrolase family 2 TIM barrel-domain containing protein [Phycisphaera mikurensis]MBB6442265.1 hypothetical protein [Phycisphaera mikurensis]BAM03135.1 hypothetical protein PSMK_09760 [Phycisphaera mikurensis NBRC 102666]